MSTRYHQDIIQAVVDNADILGIPPSKVDALKALKDSKTIIEASNKMGISDSAFTVKLRGLYSTISNAIQRLKKAQPAINNRTAIDWTKFQTIEINRLKSLPNRPEFYEDIVFLAYELPHVRNLGQKSYDNIREVVRCEIGRSMPDWRDVTRRVN